MPHSVTLDVTSNWTVSVGKLSFCVCRVIQSASLAQVTEKLGLVKAPDGYVQLLEYVDCPGLVTTVSGPYPVEDEKFNVKLGSVPLSGTGGGGGGVATTTGVGRGLGAGVGVV